MTEGSRKAVLYALCANFGIAVAKFVGFLITASAGLLAEAIHSLADTSNQALLLLGGKRARRAADREHPFGYGRERYFWSFVVALVLFSMGGLFALYEGIEKVRHPHEVELPPGRHRHPPVRHRPRDRSRCARPIRESKHSKGDSDVSWWTWLRKSKQPELPVVLLEDIGAEIGLFLALGGVLMAHFTDEPRWDAVGSISIGVLLVIIAIFLAIEMKGLLIGESASDADLDRDRRHARGRRRRAPPHPPQDPAPRPGGGARRGQARVRSRPHPGAAGRRHQRRRGGPARRGPDRPHRSTSSRTSTGRASDRGGTT